DEMVERLAVQLGEPDRCPHGWPVDTSHEQEENRDLRALSQIEVGPATIVRLAEHDGDLLHWFYDQGLVPGTALEVTRIDPSAGQLTVRIDGTERVIGERAAAGLYVLPGGADLIVLGAGPAGVGAAQRAARAGHRVVLLERAGRVGGAAGSITVAGIRADLGSHRLHPTIEPRILAE